MAHTQHMDTGEILLQLDMLYQEDIDSFDTEEGLPDMEKKNTAREKLFDMLAEKKEVLVHDQWKQAIADIMVKNQHLLEQAMRKQKDLGEKIQSTAKGRRALTGYGLLDRRSRPAKIMSFKE
ncbi:MAG: hypothetical protein LC660_13130 [Desulfobacteraceae bacterium]|nr:hypothetical protein [Desulfobacteraceae bacterium]